MSSSTSSAAGPPGLASFKTVPRTVLSGHAAGTNGSYMTAVVNGMLEALGRLAQTDGVVVIGATNHPDRIDPALIRSGRFDRKIEVTLPDRDGIGAILRAHLGEGGGWRAKLDGFTLRLVGASGADVGAVARMAQSGARDRADDPDSGVRAADLDAAIKAILPPVDPALAYRIAVHETRHAITGAAVGRMPTAVRMGQEGGETIFRPLPVHTRASAVAELACLMAGRAAERLILGDASNGAGLGPDCDLVSATRLALNLELNWGMGDAGCVWHGVSDPMPLHAIPPWLHQKLRGLLADAEAAARAMLLTHRAALHRLVEGLMEERDIIGDCLKALLPTPNRPPPRPDDTVVAFRPLEQHP